VWAKTKCSSNDRIHLAAEIETGTVDLETMIATDGPTVTEGDRVHLVAGIGTDIGIAILIASDGRTAIADVLDLLGAVLVRRTGGHRDLPMF
jgi:hypothetical protein